MTNRTHNCKLVLLGESAVGKSSIALQFVKSQFQEYQEATIGAAYLTQCISFGDPPTVIKFEIWDTAGQERYHSLAPMYYRGAHAAIVVYDITNLGSFMRARSWIDELREKAPDVKVIALAGNKLDCCQRRAVEQCEAAEYARSNGLLFCETSAKTAENVAELFKMVGEALPMRVPPSNNGAMRLGAVTDRPTGGSQKCCT